MSEYTAEDFAQANLATKGQFWVARRTDPSLAPQWHVYGSRQGWLSDEELAADGWTPVVESRVTEHTLRHVEERAERKRERLIRHISDLEATIRRRGAALEDLREKLADAERRAELAEWTQDKIAGEANDLRQEIDRLERIIQAPLSMRDLEVAWEAAEVPTDDAPMRQGDVYISTVDRNDRGLGYLVAAAGRTGTHMHFNARILSRAPREPWQDLADELDDTPSCIANEALAQRLHAQGWRKTGGDDDE